MVKFFFIMLCIFAWLNLATPAQLSKDLDPINSPNIFHQIVRMFYNSKAITNVIELLNKNHQAEIDEVLQAFNDGVGFKLITLRNGYVQADLGSLDKSLAQLDRIIPQQASQIRSAIDGIHKISAREFATFLTKPAISSRIAQKSMMTILASTICGRLTSTVSEIWADYSGRINNAWGSFVDNLGTIGGTNPIIQPIATILAQVGITFTSSIEDFATQTTSALNQACIDGVSSLGNRREIDLNRLSVQNRSYSVTSQLFKLIISIICLLIIYVVILIFGFTLYGMSLLVGPMALFFTLFQ